MFGIFPEWVGDTVTIIATVLGLPGLILWFLGRKDANRKLVVEESGLTVAQFNAALPAYKDLLDRANNERDAADKEKQEAFAKVVPLEKELSQTRAEVHSLDDKLKEAVELFRTVIERSEITLTHEELRRLERITPSSERFHRGEKEG
jgi:hypothetical protein